MKKKIKNILLITIGVLLGLTLGVSAATTIASTSVTYGDTTVQAALDELITAANPCVGGFCNTVSIGDYVSMKPTKTTYSIPAGLTGVGAQTINPRELNLWRVIRINSDGTVDMVSEYTSSTPIYLNGRTAFINYVNLLNTVASQYNNPIYTIGARCTGYGGQTPTITDTSKFTMTPPWTISTSQMYGPSFDETLGAGDINGYIDLDLIRKAIGYITAMKAGTTIKVKYYVASRLYQYTSSTSYEWGGSFVSGNAYPNFLVLHRNSGGSLSDVAQVGVDIFFRPIVTVIYNAPAPKSGDGTSTSPWVLS